MLILVSCGLYREETVYFAELALAQKPFKLKIFVSLQPRQPIAHEHTGWAHAGQEKWARPCRNWHDAVSFQVSKRLSGVTALDPQRAGFLGTRYNNSQLIKLVLKLLFCEESI